VLATSINFSRYRILSQIVSRDMSDPVVCEEWLPAQGEALIFVNPDAVKLTLTVSQMSSAPARHYVGLDAMN